MKTKLSAIFKIISIHLLNLPIYWVLPLLVYMTHDLGHESGGNSTPTLMIDVTSDL